MNETKGGGRREQLLQKFQDDEEAKKQEEQNKVVASNGNGIHKEIWPKSLKGFLQLCNAIKMDYMGRSNV